MILDLEEEARRLRNNKNGMSYIKFKDIEKEKEDIEKERNSLKDKANSLKKEKDMLVDKNENSESRIKDLSEKVGTIARFVFTQI